MGADFSLNVDEASQANSQHHFIEHKCAEGLDAFFCAVFVLVADEEVYEDVE